MRSLTILKSLEEVNIIGRFQLTLGGILILSSLFAGYITFQFQSLSVQPPIQCLSSKCLEAIKTSDGICSLSDSDWKYKDDKTNWLTEFDLTCDRIYLISLGTTIYFLGFFLSVSPLCIFVDKFGRKTSSLVFLVLQIACMALLWTSNSITQILAVRFLLGALHGGASISVCVTTSEFTSPRYATLFMMLSSAGFSIGGGVAGLFAKWSSYWQFTVLPPIVMSVLCTAVFWYLIPETPYWLFAKGYESRAIDSINIVAYYNKMPKLEHVELVSSSGEVIPPKKSQSLGIIFKSDILRNSIIFLAFNWFTVSICYYGLEFNAGTLGDEYLVMMVMGCFDTPFKIFLFYFAETYGRQISTQTYLVSCLVCLVLSGLSFLDRISVYGNFTVKTFLVVSGRAFGGSCFALFYIYTGEILPTLARSLGMSICSTSARVGSLLAPMVILVNQISPSIIYVFIVVCLVIAISMLRRIPETLGQPLPNSIQDCERLFESQGMMPSKSRLSRSDVGGKPF